jgi:hypothetical protein
MQGQEKDVIIISLVRTQGVGYISDVSRAKVAIGRAKHELWIVGKWDFWRRNIAATYVYQQSKIEGITIDELLRRKESTGP